MVKNYNSSKSNTSSVSDGDLVGDSSGGDSGAVDHNSTRSNNGLDGGGGGPDPAQGTDYNTTRSNTSSATPRDKHTGRATGKRNSVDGDGGGGGSEKSGAIDHNSTRSNRGASVGDGDNSTSAAHEAAHVVQQRGGVDGNGGGSGDGNVPTKSGGQPDRGDTIDTPIRIVEGAVGGGGGGGSGGGAAVAGDGVRGAITVEIVNPKSSGGGSHTTDSGTVMIEDGVASGGGGGSGGGTGVIGSTFGLAKTILTAAVLLTAAGVGFDLYETYNDAIDLNLEDHVTDADFALNGDKTEINGDISFNIPEMGRFEKKILAQVHVTVLESSPTTTGDYSFEYTLGSGEQTYKFSLTNLDPVTVGKINAGEDLELEYTTSITVIYLGVELAPATTDMPARIVTVETA